MEHTPGRVIIVGAGPAGMVLAFLLARRGVSVTVLEAHRDFARAFRGEGLQRSGIEVFRQIGLGEQFDLIPHAEVRVIEIYAHGRLRVRANPSGLGRAQARLVSQPALLQMLADEANAYPSFRLRRGVHVRGLLRENGRVVGVRASVDGNAREYRADLVIGADGRHAATCKHGGFPELTAPQGYDILWLKAAYPEKYPDRTTAQFMMADDGVALAFPTADGQLQVGFVIPKGGLAARKAAGREQWIDGLIARLPADLAEHLRSHPSALASATLLDVVCGRLTQWTAPGLLLIGDAAHPMSPVGGQGINIALRDAVVAANHLCPVLSAGADSSAIDAAARAVQDERWPEIVTVQHMQQHQASFLCTPDRWRARLIHRLFPLLVRTGLLQWMHRKQYRQMSEGVVPVQLTPEMLQPDLQLN